MSAPLRERDCGALGTFARIDPGRKLILAYTDPNGRQTLPTVWPIAAVLAEELGVSLRTIYRDIQTLIGQGATIDGEAGVGFVLRPGFVLPPLMFSDEELEALMLGSRLLAQRADKPLADAARNAITKIAAVLPGDLRDSIDSTGLLAGPGPRPPPDPIDLASTLGADRGPNALGFFDRVRMLAAWCELRQDFRHFRTDRITSLRATDQRFPRRRRALMKEWGAIEGIPEQRF